MLTIWQQITITTLYYNNYVKAYYVYVMYNKQ